MHDQHVMSMDQDTEYPQGAVCFQACWGKWFWFVPTPTKLNETVNDVLLRCVKSTNSGIHSVTEYGYPGDMIAGYGIGIVPEIK